VVEEDEFMKDMTKTELKNFISEEVSK